jgi:ornithine--oxo-acid transaminase
MMLETDSAPKSVAGLDILQLIKQHEGRNYELHAEHVNPANVRTLKTIGFDHCYVRAEGPYLWDVQGVRYLDMLSGYGVFGLGRNHPEVRRVLIDFLSADYPSLVKMEAPLLSGLLAAELKKRMPNQLDMVFFTNSGAEGVETAIKYAKCATGRPAIVHCKKAFHGLTYGALSLNGDESFREGFEPFLPIAGHSFDDLGARTGTCAGRRGGFIVEPVQARASTSFAGYSSRPPLLPKRRAFVADEVQTGMGRTGRFLPSNMTGMWTRTSWYYPRPFPAASFRWAQCCARSGSTKKCFRACNVRWCIRPHSARAAWRWPQVSRRSM